MGRHWIECNLPNYRYTYTVLHGVTSNEKQICAEFSGKYDRRCQFERCESETAILKKSLAFFCGLNVFMAQLSVGPLS